MATTVRTVYPHRKFADLSGFVRLWQRAPSLAYVSQHLRTTPNTAAAIAARLRKNGVPLKLFVRRGWNNRLLRELGRYCKLQGQPAHFVVAAQSRQIRALEQDIERLKDLLRRAENPTRATQSIDA